MTSAPSAEPSVPANAVDADGSLRLSLGDIGLQSGAKLTDATLVLKSWGELNTARDNAILISTSFGATHRDFEWMIGADSLFDPTRYFIVIANLFGNGLSSSPSTSATFAERWCFPAVTAFDNALVQKFALDRMFGICRLALVAGWSMGGQVAYHMAALFPDDVERLLPICASAKTAQHNVVFLEGARAVLCADCAYDPKTNWFIRPPQRALSALGRYYAGWALSQQFYRQELWRPLGYETLEDFLRRYWEAGFAGKDANNLLAQINTWQLADISANPLYEKDMDKALRAIRAYALVMPGESDLYFPVEDCAQEAARMPRARLCPIPSPWGHRAGNPVRSAPDRAFLRQRVHELLAEDGPQE